MTQKELSLEYRVLEQDNCRHPALRFDGLQEDGEGGTIPLLTCHHPNLPHCGGTFDARKYNRNGVVLYKGKTYSLDYLRDWYRPAS